MKNKFLKIALVLSAIILTTACNEDDATGYSTNTPSSPSLSVTLDFEGTQTLIETEATYGFTVSISEAQITNVNVNLSQTDGTATNGEDFDIPSTVTIPAGSTSVSDVITIHEDDLAEETETAVIQITNGTEANVSPINGATAEFSILNYTEGDLVIDLTWTSPTNFTDNLGVAIEDEAIADLILYVTDPNIPTSINYTSVDIEAGFETFVFLESFPDGEYYLVSEFFSVEDFSGLSADLDISLTFNQPGVINDEIITVATALNTAYVSCQSVVLAKITKAGMTYTLEKIGLNNNAGIPSDGTFVGEYSVETTVQGGFGPQFDAASVTLVDEGNGIRSFVGDWNGFGVEATYEIQFVAACGTATFIDGQETGLACGNPIIHGASSNTEVRVNPTDDSSFSVTYTENTESACGLEPTTDVTITFTKL